MNDLTKQLPIINIYACGGAGINIMRDYDLTSLPKAANINIVYIDTSNSNLLKNTDNLNIYKINELDGSGQHRATNVAIIAEHINNCMGDFPPEQFNIVISSASGGSGSVFAPLITKYIMEQDSIAIPFLIGDTTTTKYLDNTVSTLASYQHISENLNLPLNIAFYENTRNIQNKDNNTTIHYGISAIRFLLSGLNAGLDSKDIYNFFRYSDVTNLKPSFNTLIFLNGKENVSQANKVAPYEHLAAALLLVSDDTSSSEFLNLYGDNPLPFFCTGVLEDSSQKKLISPFAFIINTEHLNVLGVKYNEKKIALINEQAARIKPKSIVSNMKKPKVENGIII